MNFGISIVLLLYCGDKVKCGPLSNTSFKEQIFHGGYWWRLDKMTQNPSNCKSMSGVWERQISVHVILASMLKMHGKSLDNESLLILMTEVEGILNSWPLVVEMINDPSSFQPLSLANILTIKSKVVMPPPG